MKGSSWQPRGGSHLARLKQRGGRRLVANGGGVVGGGMSGRRAPR